MCVILCMHAISPTGLVGLLGDRTFGQPVVHAMGLHENNWHTKTHLASREYFRKGIHDYLQEYRNCRYEWRVTDRFL